MPMKIQKIHAREVLDSRGNPTVAVMIELDDGARAEAMVPSGASTGVHEALELRDNDQTRYGGKGVLTACHNVNTAIAQQLVGMDAADQRAIDEALIALDGTENKSSLGANALLGVSLAIARVRAVSQKKPLYQSIRDAFALSLTEYRLPYPMMNIVNGGEHANNNVDVQECMIVPQQTNCRERIRCGAEVFHALKSILDEKGDSTAVGDEGGFAPNLPKNEDGLKLIAEAVEKAGYVLGTNVMIAMDPAASEFYKEGVYVFDGEKKTASEMTAIFSSWIDQYHIVSIEDGLAEDDWEGWKDHTVQLGGKIALVGDDLFVTNQKRLQKGIDEKVANAILIKVNQIGTLSETIDTILLARKHHYKVVVSHRSGETEDTFIADLAVAVNADYIKTGSLSRSDRVAKYNRLLAIEEELL